MGEGSYSNNWGGRREGAGRPKGSIDPRPRELREAMIEGAKNSKYGKDPNNPEAPGTLENFFANAADENLADFLVLFGRLIPRQINTQVEFYYRCRYHVPEYWRSKRRNG